MTLAHIKIKNFLSHRKRRNFVTGLLSPVGLALRDADRQLKSVKRY